QQRRGAQRIDDAGHHAIGVLLEQRLGDDLAQEQERGRQDRHGQELAVLVAAEERERHHRRRRDDRELGAEERRREERLRLVQEPQAPLGAVAPPARLAAEGRLTRGHDGDLRPGEERLGHQARRHDQNGDLERDHDGSSASGDGGAAAMTWLVFSSRIGPNSATRRSSIVTSPTRRPYSSTTRARWVRVRWNSRNSRSHLVVLGTYIGGRSRSLSVRPWSRPVDTPTRSLANRIPTISSFFPLWMG